MRITKNINPQGYVELWLKDEKRKILEHRFVMEQHLGRKLKHNEIIHHIDKDRTNNKIENLRLFKGNSKHRKLHYKLQNEQGEIYWFCNLCNSKITDEDTYFKISPRGKRLVDVDNLKKDICIKCFNKLFNKKQD